jgi:sugar lactone lactonase YvrE
MLSTPKAHPVGTVRAILGEGPTWDVELGRLYWVDIHSSLLHEFDPDTGCERSFEVPGQPGCVLVKDATTLIAAVEDRLLEVGLCGGGQEVIAQVEHPPRLRFNDGKCDSSGRLWVGSMDREETEALGQLYRWSGTELESVQEEVTISNGIGWSPDDRRMYYIDSPQRCVWEYEYDLESGEVSNRRVLRRFEEADGFPDGMTVDEEGFLWIAFWGGGKILRLDPGDGREVGCLRLPASNVTSCAFGGEGFDQLFITTARGGLKEDEEPLAGRIFVCNPGVLGLPSTRIRL